VTRLRLVRIFWVGAAAIMVVAALVALGAVLRGDFSDTDGRILITLGALLYCGGAALAGLALADRGPARRLGWAVAATAPLGLALIVWALWSFTFDGDGNEIADKLAWSAVLVLLVGLMTTTDLLLARAGRLVGLARASAAFAAVAASLSIAGIWTEDGGDAIVKTVAALWILACLTYFLVPILRRFTNAGVEPTADRVLATLDGVDLVLTRSGDGVQIQLIAGERLTLRRRP
jgi:hypothetical protein